MPATVGNGLLAALAVLTPVLSAAAAAIFLLLGYGLQLAGAQQPLAIALIRVAGSPGPWRCSPPRLRAPDS